MTGCGETKMVRNSNSNDFLICHFSAVKYTGGLGNSGRIKALKDHTDTSVSHLIILQFRFSL